MRPAKKPYLATRASSEIWSDPYTKLPGPAERQFYDLYVMIDIFSRYITQPGRDPDHIFEVDVTLGTPPRLSGANTYRKETSMTEPPPGNAPPDRFSWVVVLSTINVEGGLDKQPCRFNREEQERRGGRRRERQPASSGGVNTMPSLRARHRGGLVTIVESV
ncbi:hypothetical protein [Nonomuraea sp. NPDC049784]|uniref:hypothetical protein n=1 Tax=Nonomuraea sp. NPDC049784 TaxID=3154361 RepID=UPI0034032D0F